MATKSISKIKDKFINGGDGNAAFEVKVDADGKVIRYNLVDGEYVVDENGEFIELFVLDGDGNHRVDVDNSSVSVAIKKTSKEVFEIKWAIEAAELEEFVVKPLYTQAEIRKFQKKNEMENVKLQLVHPSLFQNLLPHFNGLLCTKKMNI